MRRSDVLYFVLSGLFREELADYLVLKSRLRWMITVALAAAGRRRVMQSARAAAWEPVSTVLINRLLAQRVIAIVDRHLRLARWGPRLVRQ